MARYPRTPGEPEACATFDANIGLGPNTSKKHPQNKIYHYLLRGLEINRPNQVWSTDITYIRLAQGFMYLAAVIDW